MIHQGLRYIFDQVFHKLFLIPSPMMGEGLGDLLARLGWSATLGFCLFGFLDEYVNSLAFFEALEAIEDTGALENLCHRFGWQRAVLHPIVGAVFLDMNCRRLCAGVIE